MSRFKPRDVIAGIALIGVMALVATGKVTWTQALPIMLAVLGAYGMARRRSK
jgi:hypothetical protein